MSRSATMEMSLRRRISSIKSSKLHYVVADQRIKFTISVSEERVIHALALAVTVVTLLRQEGQRRAKNSPQNTNNFGSYMY